MTNDQCFIEIDFPSDTMLKILNDYTVGNYKNEWRISIENLLQLGSRLTCKHDIHQYAIIWSVLAKHNNLDRDIILTLFNKPIIF